MTDASAATSERLEIRMKSVVIGIDGELGLVEQIVSTPCLVRRMSSLSRAGR